jgi:hypothetical protein
MGNRLALTALVTGFPAGLRQPKPLPGETLSQLVIRNHPREWLNFIERLAEKIHLSPEQAGALRAGQLSAIQSEKVWAEIEGFMNFRLPTHGRTIQCLDELRGLQEKLKDEAYGMVGDYDLLEILWPRQRDPSGDASAEKMVESLGAKVIPMLSGAPLTLNLADLLQHVHGDLLWLVPGGTSFMAPIADLQIRRVVRHFQAMQRCAMYADNVSSFIYRTSVLRDLIARGQLLPADSREMVRALQMSGYELAMDEGTDNALCELEPEYGGPRRKIQRRAGEKRSWWRRWLGR